MGIFMMRLLGRGHNECKGPMAGTRNFLLISVCVLYVLLRSLISNICLSLPVKRIYFKEYIVKSCLLIQSDNIYLLFEVFKTSPFNAIIKCLGSICHLITCFIFLTAVLCSLSVFFMHSFELIYYLSCLLFTFIIGLLVIPLCFIV